MKIKKIISLFLSAAIAAGVALSVPVSVSAVDGRGAVEESFDIRTNKATIDFYSNMGATINDVSDIMVKYKNYMTDKRITLKLHGNFKIDKTVSIPGDYFTIDATDAVITGTADLLLDCWGYGGQIIRGGTWNLSDKSRLIKLSNSYEKNIIENMTVNGGSSDKYGVVFFYGAKYSEIRNCKFNNVKSQAIYIHHSEKVVVADNTFNNINGHAICLYGGYVNSNTGLYDPQYSRGCTIVGNNITNVCGDGIKCVQYSNTYDPYWNELYKNFDSDLKKQRGEYECNISGNNVWNVKLNKDLDYDELKGEARSGVGIMIMESYNVNVGKAVDCGGKTYIGNSVKNTENYGMVINLSDGINVEQTYFNDIGTNGIHNTASSGTTIKDCGFTNCKEIGIFFIPGPDPKVPIEKQQCLNSLVKNTKITKCGSFGIDLAKTVQTKIDKNIVTNCKDYGVYCIAAKNIAISDNMVGGTKSAGGTGINFNSECSGIRISGTVNMALVLDKTALSLGSGESSSIKATVIPSSIKDKTVKWRTSNSRIVTVTQNGTVTAKGAGTAWVTASLSNGMETTCKITVKNAPTKITLTKGILTIGVGEKYTIGSGVNDGAACAKRTYRTSNSSIVRMTRTDWQGEFVGVKPGIAYVTVRTYNGKESTCKVTVKAAPRSVTISKKSMTLRVGQSATLSSSIPADAGCAARTYRTSNSSILKMTKTDWTGQFKALKPGIAYITVRTYNGKESACKVTVIR